MQQSILSPTSPSFSTPSHSNIPSINNDEVSHISNNLSKLTLDSNPGTKLLHQSEITSNLKSPYAPPSSLARPTRQIKPTRRLIT